MTASGRGDRIRVLALPAYFRTAQNPFTRLLYDEVRKLDVDVEDWTWWRAAWRSCDIWHMHHPDTVVFPRRRWQAAGETLTMRCLLALARLRGIRVVWTVHDLGSHDGLHPALERWFWRYFPPAVDAFVSLSETGRDLAPKHWPALADTPGFVAQHGHFRDIYPDTMDRAEARARLGLDPDRPVVLHFGLIRPYKSVPELIDAFRGMPGERATLLVAGKVWDTALDDEIRARASDRDDIDLRTEWIPFEDTQLYFKACDLVVLPYRRILNSGAALLALGFERPVLVPDMGAMPDLLKRFGPGWIRLFEGEITSDSLGEAIDWAMSPRPAPVDWTGLDWPTLARKHREIYDAVLGNRAETARSPSSSSAGDV